MEKQAIKIFQGDAVVIEETITGLASLADYTAKMYVKKKDGTEIDTLTGSIVSLVITYTILNEDSKAYPIGDHNFETKLFDAEDHVYTPSKGIFIVEQVLKEDPS